MTPRSTSSSASTITSRSATSTASSTTRSASAYHPFLQAIAETGGGLSLTVHCSGRPARHPQGARAAHLRPAGALAADGQVELLTGGFYEPILALLPDWDKVGQIQALTQFLKSSFGVTARGMWLAERIWEPQLPRVLREAGVEFVLVDDSHFALAGLDPETLGGYYLTEEQGASVAVFPINQRLRYLVPFADPAESVRYLETRRGAGAVTMVDDGEKFGVWPGTDRLVYGERWLARFLDALRADPVAARLHVLALPRHRAPGRARLPADRRRTPRWASGPCRPPPPRSCTTRAPAWPRCPTASASSRLLRGGFFRNFLIKYPEIGDAYWKMIRLSRRVHEGLTARPRDPRLLAARERLWQGQANDAYWHGVFGGCYLPHLRRAVKSALIGCERAAGGPGQAAGARLRARRHRRRRDGRGGRAHALARADPAPGPRRLAHRAALARRGDGHRRRAHPAPGGLSPAGRGAAVGGRGGRGEDDPLGPRGQGGGAARAAPLRSLPPRLPARRAVPSGGRARSARSVGRGAAGGRRATPRSRGEDLAARGGAAVLAPASRRPAAGDPEVRRGHGATMPR